MGGSGKKKRNHSAKSLGVEPQSQWAISCALKEKELREQRESLAKDYSESPTTSNSESYKAGSSSKGTVGSKVSKNSSEEGGELDHNSSKFHHTDSVGQDQYAEGHHEIESAFESHQDSNEILKRKKRIGGQVDKLYYPLSIEEASLTSTEEQEKPCSDLEIRLIPNGEVFVGKGNGVNSHDGAYVSNGQMFADTSKQEAKAAKRSNPHLLSVPQAAKDNHVGKPNGNKEASSTMQSQGNKHVDSLSFQANSGYISLHHMPNQSSQYGTKVMNEEGHVNNSTPGSNKTEIHEVDKADLVSLKTGALSKSSHGLLPLSCNLNDTCYKASHVAINEDSHYAHGLTKLPSNQDKGCYPKETLPCTLYSGKAAHREEAIESHFPHYGQLIVNKGEASRAEDTSEAHVPNTLLMRQEKQAQNHAGLNCARPNTDTRLEGNVQPISNGPNPNLKVQTQGPSWASMLKPKVISDVKLRYTKHDKTKDRIKITMPKELIQEGSKAWDFTLVGYFIGKRLPFSLVKSVATRLWGKTGLQDLLATDSGYFFFKFNSQEESNAVLEGGPWHIGGQPIILKNWHVGLELTKEAQATIPLWVNIYNIPLEYWNPEGLGFIASAVGKPLHVHKMTATCQRISFARLCVEVSAEYELVKEFDIEFEDPNSGELTTITLKVEYQWSPIRCSKCKKFGHNCVNLPKVQKYAKQAPRPPSRGKQDEEVWMVVTKGKNVIEHIPVGSTSTSEEEKVTPILGNPEGNEENIQVANSILETRQTKHGPAQSKPQTPTEQNFSLKGDSIVYTINANHNHNANNPNKGLPEQNTFAMLEEEFIQSMEADIDQCPEASSSKDIQGSREPNDAISTTVPLNSKSGLKNIISSKMNLDDLEVIQVTKNSQTTIPNDN